MAIVSAGLKTDLRYVAVLSYVLRSCLSWRVRCLTKAKRLLSLLRIDADKKKKTPTKWGPPYIGLAVRRGLAASLSPDSTSACLAFDHLNIGAWNNRPFAIGEFYFEYTSLGF